MPVTAQALMRNMGEDGILISFADDQLARSNAAAIAFDRAINEARIDGVFETAPSLRSVFVRFDPCKVDHSTLENRLGDLLTLQDWADAPLQAPKKWRVPTLFGGDNGPHLIEVANQTGLPADEVIDQIAATDLHVLTIGYAPGMPYLGGLSSKFDIPRRAELTRNLPQGGIACAIRQIVLFPQTTQTGWSWIGRASMLPFLPNAKEPFLLSAGDQIRFLPASVAEFTAARAAFEDGKTSSYCEVGR